MLVMIRDVTNVNNDIADSASASTLAQDRKTLDTDIAALQAAEQVVAQDSGDDLAARKPPGQGSATFRASSWISTAGPSD